MIYFTKISRCTDVLRVIAFDLPLEMVEQYIVKIQQEQKS